MASRPRVRGSETPRLFTPPLRELTPQTSLGFAAVDFATNVCRFTLNPWQRWLLIHALELAPGLTVATMSERHRLDPLFRFRKIVVLVARQNGKTLVSQILSLFFLYVLRSELVLGTAQDLDTAEEVWDGAQDIIEEIPELAGLAGKPILVNGKKTIRLKSGERYKVKAANRRAGRGLSGDLVLLDELREHQTWDAYGAITKTTNARPAAMIWAMSNAGDAASVVLRHLRRNAHRALGDPDGILASDAEQQQLPDVADVDELNDEDIEDIDDVDTLGLFEWSAPPGCSVLDRDGWAMANPSLGYTVSERTLAGDAKDDPEWIFRTEVLCQWADGSIDGPFPPGAWIAGTDAESERAADAEVVVGVDTSSDRETTHIFTAGLRADGAIHVARVASRSGSDWVAGWFTDPNEPHRAKARVAIQGRGAPASPLIESLENAGVAVERWHGSDLSDGCAKFYDLVRGEDGKPGLFHRPDPVLDVVAATAATKPLANGGWVWDRRKSPQDVAPLMAANAAVWLLQKKPEKPRVSVYEERGALIV